ncbi:MAG: GNAT family N-acetyltransferase [Thermotogaceae bacterium]|nr:GNAT family N-acetyltransferase [Mesotoga sp.]NLX34571.1 GNAT family N-acetyltransferase [Thermotogaceae bacterium]MDD4041764.1 GNAT family N-acetyltransferase [Mesotoga sp.]HPI18235.1 GNAT family N-acetyltransferase [Mesotoga sp.]HPX23532.1 GNAT family N-acetyltransferase [Mesotoga sp.]
MIFKEISDYREMIEVSALAFSFEKRDRDELEELFEQLVEGGRLLYGTYDGETLVAGCVVYPYRMRLRESAVTMGGIALVCSRQDYRGKGGVRLLLSATLESMRDLGYPVSVLYPFQRDFYRKYGWEVFDRWQLIKFSPSSIRDFDSGDIDARDMAFPDEESIEFYRRYASSSYNYVLRNQTDWRDRLSPVWSSQVAKRVVRFTRQSEVVGLMDYSINLDRKEGSYFHSILTFVSKDEKVRQAMFSYIKSLSHQVNKIHLFGPMNCEIWPYLYDKPDECQLREGSMIRIVDIMKLDGLMLDSPDVKIALKIEDAQCPWNVGGIMLEIRDGVLNLTKIPEEEAQLEIGIGAISTVIGGRESLRRMVELKMARILKDYNGEDIQKCDVFMNEPF